MRLGLSGELKFHVGENSQEKRKEKKWEKNEEEKQRGFDNMKKKKHDNK